MKPSSCSAAPDPHIVTAHTASAKSVLVHHVYWIKQQTDAASLFMETARSLDNVMVAPRHANVIAIVSRSFRLPSHFNLNQTKDVENYCFSCITIQSHDNCFVCFLMCKDEWRDWSCKTIISMITVLYFSKRQQKCTINYCWSREMHYSGIIPYCIWILIAIPQKCGSLPAWLQYSWIELCFNIRSITTIPFHVTVH